MIAGTLEVQMLANLARLSDDMGKAKSMVGSAMGNIERDINRVKSAFGALGIGLSALGFAALIKGSIDAADKLNDLSKSTHIAVGDLAGLNLLAKQTGMDLDGLAKAINKMSVEMGKSPEKFKALGITAKDNLGALKQFSDVFNKLPDIQQRNALAQAVFGKSWAEMATVLEEGGKRIGEIVEQGKRLSGITPELVRQADELNDKWATLGGTGGFMTRMIGPLLPLLNGLADDMLKAQEKTNDLAESFNPLLETFKVLLILGGNVSFVLKGIGNDLGGMAAQLAALGRGDFAGFSAIHKAMVEDAAKARAEFDAWEKKIMSSTGKPKDDTLARLEAAGGSMAGLSAAEKAAAAFLGQGKADASDKAAEHRKKIFDDARDDELERIRHDALEEQKLFEKNAEEQKKLNQELAKDRYAAMVAEAEWDRKNQEKEHELEMKARKEEAELAQKLLEKEAEARQKMIDQINQSLTDALMRGFESGKGFAENFINTIQNMFNTLVLRPIISAIVSPVGTAISGGLTGLFGSGAALAGDGSSGGSIFSAISNGFSLLSGSLSETIAGMAGHIGGGIGQFLLGNSEFLGAAIPAIGLGIAALGLFGGGLFGSHIMRPKGYANTSISSSGVANIGSWTNGEGNVSQQAIDAGMQLGKFVDDMAKKLGGSIEKSFIVGTKYMAKYGSISVKVGGQASRDGMDFTFLASDKNAVSNAFARTFLDSVQKGLVNLDPYLEAYIGKMKDGKPGNSAQQAKFLQNAIDLKGLYDSLDLLPDIFKRVQIAIENVASKDMLERMKALTDATQSFYNTFAPEATKVADNSAYVHKQLAALNVAFPESREGFFKFVSGLDTSTQASLDLYTTLVNLSGAGGPMDAYFKSLEGQADAAMKAAEAIALSTDNYATFTDFMRAKAYIKNGTSLSMLPANMPSYDVGTDYVPVTGPALIHQGEAILPAGQNANLASSLSAAVVELRAVKAELSTMKKTLSDISRDSRKTSDTLVRVTLDGASMQTRAVA